MEKESVDVSPLWELMNSLDPDTKFIFKIFFIVANFLDVSCSIKNDQLVFDILPQAYTFVLLLAFTAAVTRNILKIILFCHWDKESFE